MSVPGPLLALDVGNTSVSLGLFRGRRLVRSRRLLTREVASDRRVGRRISSRLGLGKDTRLKAAVFASVVPSLDRALAAALKARFRCPIFKVGPGSRLGLPIRVARPGEVGADRIVNALAVREMCGCPAVVVDFGSATTVDCVSKDGAYLGGAIMPGPGMSAEALGERTAKLPSVSLRRPARAIGRSTVECIRAGLYFGHQGMVRGVLERTMREMGTRQRVQVLLTGGYAGLFGRGLWPGARHVPDLTLQGLRVAYEALSGRRNDA